MDFTSHGLIEIENFQQVKLNYLNELIRISGDIREKYTYTHMM